MAIAVASLCVDPRLSHELVRVQLRSRFEAMGLRSDSIYLVNDIGGNLGSGLRNTLQMLARQQEPIVAVALLHHDDCRADQQHLRIPLDRSLRELATYLDSIEVSCPVIGASMITETNEIVWPGDRQGTREQFNFRMPSMFGVRESQQPLMPRLFGSGFRAG